MDEGMLNIDNAPRTNIQQCVIHAFNEETNEKAAELRGKSLHRDVLNNAVTLYDCTGEIFSSDKTTAQITSNTASLDGTGTNVVFSGNVIVTNEPDTSLFTSELFYNIKKERIYTHQEITIDEKDKITTGKGLESNLKLKRARILNNVKIVTKK